METREIIVTSGYEGIGRCLEGEKQVYLVYDANVEPWARKVLGQASFGGALRLEVCEAGKSMDKVLEICSFLQQHEADRDALVVAMGGGLTTDMVGFAAAIYKRGVRFATVPTTLLAMVDAAVGGKTGCNFAGLKNILGAFHQPLFVYAALESLQTLPRRELLSGAAELLKSFIIAQPEHYVPALQQIAAGIPDAETVRAAIAVKEDIVKRDFKENGDRRLLNLGHTIGHAIEWYQHETGLKHGEAVAVGIVCAAKVSEALGVAPEGLAERFANDLRSVGLPTECPVPFAELEEAVRQDKKAASGHIHFVLVSGVGSCSQRELTAAEIIEILSK